MRLPGTRYQEHGWEQVRKLLGLCSLAAFAHTSPARLLDPSGRLDALSEYVDHTSGALRAAWRSSRAESPGNSYGESVLELPAGRHAVVLRLDPKSLPDYVKVEVDGAMFTVNRP